MKGLVRAALALQQRILPGLKADRIPLVGKPLRRLLSRFRGRTATVQGHVMKLDPEDSLLLSLRPVYEPTETAFVLDYVQPGHRVVDVGANIGYYTLLFARSVGEGGEVLAFEPDPGNYRLLAENVAANGYADRVDLHHAGVSDRPGTLSLYRSEDNRGDHRTYDPGGGRPSVSVPAVALDDVVHGPVDLVKMDIQGWEPVALRGMRRLLDESPDVVLVTELWPAGMAGAGESAEAYLEALRGHGFRLSLVDERQRRVRPIDDGELRQLLGALRGDEGINLVASRGLLVPGGR